MGYQCEATSIEGFVKQVAVHYLLHGHYFYVTGQVPEDKDPRAVDRKLIERYRVGVDWRERAIDKRAGRAHVHYIRYDRFWILMATHGSHRLFERESRRDEKGREVHIKDARRTPIKFEGYSIGMGVQREKRDARIEREANGVARRRTLRVRVAIEQSRFEELRGYMLDVAIRQSPEGIMREFAKIRDEFEPYAGVLGQLKSILKEMNTLRKKRGFAKVSYKAAIQWKFRPVKVFEPVELERAA